MGEEEEDEEVVEEEDEEVVEEEEEVVEEEEVEEEAGLPAECSECDVAGGYNCWVPTWSVHCWWSGSDPAPCASQNGIWCGESRRRAQESENEFKPQGRLLKMYQ